MLVWLTGADPTVDRRSRSGGGSIGRGRCRKWGVGGTARGHGSYSDDPWCVNLFNPLELGSFSNFELVSNTDDTLSPLSVEFQHDFDVVEYVNGVHLDHRSLNPSPVNGTISFSRAVGMVIPARMLTRAGRYCGKNAIAPFFAVALLHYSFSPIYHALKES